MKKILTALFTITFVVSCANMGGGPDGGPYDETPPHIVDMTSPQHVGQAQQGGKKKHRKTAFELIFNELIAIDNPTENVIVSPPQQEVPTITAVGKRIKVELLDSLKPNTTYTVDFADAIKDSNEGNPLGHFTYIFSTGAQTDTMQMAGYVLNAEDLEPVAGILVGLHPGTRDVAPQGDTLFTRTPFDRVARTNGDGHFSIKGVAQERQYNAYALKDGDGDFAFSQPTEQIAFSRALLTPGSFPDIRHDTVWVDTVTIDSIRHTPFTHFTPDDIVLLAFQEKNQPRALLKTDRTDAESFKAFFTAPSAHVPEIRGINFDARNAFVQQRNVGNDSITYWLRDSTLIRQDTLSMCYTYMAWDDSLKTHRLRTDTIDVTARTPWEKRMDNARKEREKREKQIERLKKRGKVVENLPDTPNTPMDIKVGANLSPAENVVFNFRVPVARIDEEAVHLMLVVDSVETPAPYELDTVPNNIMARCLRAEWRPEQQYVLRIDSAAVEDIYHHVSAKQEKKFKIETLDNFGTLFVTLAGLDSLVLDPLSAGIANTSQAVLSTSQTELGTAQIADSTSQIADSISQAALSISQAVLSISQTVDSVAINGMTADSTAIATPAAQPTALTAYDRCIVQLLTANGQVAYTTTAHGRLAEFYYIREGDYYLRCIVDRNGNGEWDTGEWASRRAPEEVFYKPEAINIRAGWDVNEDWNVTALPLFRQKPQALIKQRAGKKRQSNAHERNIQRLEERSGRAEKDKRNRRESGF